MTDDKKQKMRAFLKELEQLSKKYGMWVGQYSDYSSLLYDEDNDCLVEFWPRCAEEKPHKPFEYDWR